MTPASAYAFTAETLAERWEVSSATVRNLVRAGALRAFRVGRQIRIRPEAVEEYECQTGGSNSTGANMPPCDPSTARRTGAILSGLPELPEPLVSPAEMALACEEFSAWLAENLAVLESGGEGNRPDLVLRLAACLRRPMHRL